MKKSNIGFLESPKYYNKIAVRYHANQLQYYDKHLDITREKIRKLLGPIKGKRLVDIGCGSGIDLPFYEKEGSDVYGFDSSEDMIIHTKKVASASDVSVQNMHTTMYEDSFFDIAVSRYVIDYSSRLSEVFDEVARIVKPGGEFVFCVNHPFLLWKLKTSKDYLKREVVQLSIFDASVRIQKPSNTFSDYFTLSLFNNFDIIHFEEGVEQKGKFSDNSTVPEFFIMKLRRK